MSVNCNLIYSFSVDDFFPAEEVPYRNKRLFTAVLGSNLHITKIDPVYINDPFIGSIAIALIHGLISQKKVFFRAFLNFIKLPLTRTSSMPLFDTATFINSYSRGAEKAGLLLLP